MKKIIKLLALTVCVLLSSGCSLVSPVTSKIVEPYIRLSFEASIQVNLDNNGHASPITVKVLQLSDRITFDNLSFERAYYQPELLLGDELLAIKTIYLQPGESLKQKLELEPKVEFIAVIAGFLTIEDSNWKQVYAIDDYWYYYQEVNLNSHGLNIEKSNKNER